MNSKCKTNNSFMRTLNIILWVIVVVAGANSLLFFWRGGDAVLNHEGLLQLLWIFKMITYTGIIFLVCQVFRVRQALLTQDGPAAIRHIRVLCGIAFIAALFNSFANAGLETQIEFGKNPVSWQEAKGSFWFHALEQVFDGSLLIYILIISLFLLSGFARIAARLKSENESFI